MMNINTDSVCLFFDLFTMLVVPRVGASESTVRGPCAAADTAAATRDYGSATRMPRWRAVRDVTGDTGQAAHATEASFRFGRL